MTKSVFLILLLVIFRFPASAQEATPAFHETQRIGRGAVLDAEWHPYGSYILVNTVIGAWLYGPMLEDVAYLPDARLGTFSPSGSWIAGVDAENRLTLWQTAEGFKEVARLPGHERYVIALEWSPDGKQLASVDRDGVLLVWDMEARQILYRLHMDDGRQIAWSRGGSYLAVTGGYDVQVWNQAGEVVLANHSEYESIWNPAWRDDTQLLYSVCETAGCDVQLWNVPTQTMIFQRGLGSASEAHFSPGSSLLAFGNITGLWVENADNGDLVASFNLEPFRKEARTTAWSPDGRYVAFGESVWLPDKPSTVWVMDVGSGKIVAEFSNHTLSIKAIYWSPDNHFLLTIDDTNRLFIFDVAHSINKTAALEPDYTIRHTLIGKTAAWKSDNRLIANADPKGDVYLWDTVSGTQSMVLRAHSQPVAKLAWQPQGDLLATGLGYLWPDSNNSVYVWDTSVKTDAPRPIMTIPHWSSVMDVAWNADGTALASTELVHLIHVWRVNQPNRVLLINTETDTFYALALEDLIWSPDGSAIAFKYSRMAALTDAVGITKIATGELFPGHPELRRSGAWGWTPDGEYIWADTAENECADSSLPFELQVMRGYGADAEVQQVCLSDAPEQISEVVFSPDKRLLAGFDWNDWYKQGYGAVWDIQTGQQLLDYKQVGSMSWSPDGAYLVIRYVDDARTTEIVEVASGKVAVRFQDWQIDQIAWSPDSRKFALLDQGVMFIYERTE